jgi:hypothetical protein
VRDARTFSLHERLAEAAACLERLHQQRASAGDPILGMATEKRIIWRELLDLELQAFDEQNERLSSVARNLLADTGDGRSR